jgi:hypothetical protein
MAAGLIMKSLLSGAAPDRDVARFGTKRSKSYRLSD